MVLSKSEVLSQLQYRLATPSDIPFCWEIEAASYPADEAASLESLQYRQANAGDFFLCAVLDDDTIVGFVCSTRCSAFVDESMSTHVATGPLLAIHSVAVNPNYRRLGIATAMMKAYVERVEKKCQQPQVPSEFQGMESILLIAKNHLLGFYVNCGFQVNRPSLIVHGDDLWYELERRLLPKYPRKGQNWFLCKTKPTAELVSNSRERIPLLIKAHLEWVQEQRRQGACMTSGCLVDKEGNQLDDGSRYVVFAAGSYAEAEKLVLQEPLIGSGIVQWDLDGWAGQAGAIEMK